MAESAQPTTDEVTVRCRNDAPAAWDIAYPWVEDGAQACKLAGEIERYARSRIAALEKQLAEVERENRELRAAKDIGEVRRSLFLPQECEWNGIVRDITAQLEKPGMVVDEREVLKALAQKLRDQEMMRLIGAALSGRATEQKEGE